MRIIDVWMQTGGTGKADNSATFSTLARWTRAGTDQPKNDEHFAISKMDEGGVDIGLIAAWCGPQGFSITNDDVARCINAYPDRFRGLASVNLYQPMDAVRELRKSPFQEKRRNPNQSFFKSNRRATVQHTTESFSGLRVTRELNLGFRVITGLRER